MTTTTRRLAAIGALAAGVLAAMPAGAQQFTLKLSSPTINDATHEFYKTLKAGIEQRAPGNLQFQRRLALRKIILLSPFIKAFP